MKYGFYFLLVTMIVSFLVGMLTNCFSKGHSNAQKNPAEFPEQPLLKDPSICNAVEINQTSSNKNKPVRPKGEVYSDGLISEIKVSRNPLSPENLLINIRDQVSKSVEALNDQ